MLDVLPVPVLPASTFAIHDREEAASHHHEHEGASGSSC